MNSRIERTLGPVEYGSKRVEYRSKREGGEMQNESTSEFSFHDSTPK